jgi:transposase
VLRRGLSVREAARELGISASSFARLVRSRCPIEVMAIGQAVP